MTPERGEQLIEKITANTVFWYNDRAEAPKKDREKSSAIYEVEQQKALQAQVEALTHMMKQFMQSQSSQGQGGIPPAASHVAP